MTVSNKGIGSALVLQPRQQPAEKIRAVLVPVKCMEGFSRDHVELV